MKIAEFRKFPTVVKKIKNWPVYIFDRLRLIKGKFIIYYFRNGQKMKIRAGTTDRIPDRIPINEVFVYNDYTPKGFEIKGQDVVVDIGAHIGSFSVFASRFASKVYSFEPVNDNYVILQENLEMNKIKNVYSFKMAVSDKTGEKELFICDNNCGGHSFYINGKSSKKTMVPTISLEDLMVSNNIYAIDFLKMDCEGAEYDILLNCPKRILDKIKKISMEYHNID